MVQIRVSERTYDLLQAGGQYPLLEQSALDDTLAASPEESHAIPDTVQGTPPAQRTPARQIVFSPVRQGRERMRDQPGNVRTFYRQAFHETLEELYEASETEETRDLTRRYWDHVQEEIPESSRDFARNVRRQNQ
jgi:hypothetical protein